MTDLTFLSASHEYNAVPIGILDRIYHINSHYDTDWKGDLHIYQLYNTMNHFFKTDTITSK